MNSHFEHSTKFVYLGPKLSRMHEYTPSQLRKIMVNLSKRRMYWIAHEAPLMKTNIRTATKPYVYCQAGLEMIAAKDLTPFNIEMMDDQAVEELASKMASIRIKLVELLQDCEARSFNNSEKKKHVC